MRTALLLIALGFGFKIFAEASTNAKKSVKQVGRFVGIVIMLVSFLATISIDLLSISYYGKTYCPRSMKKMCPFMGSMFNSQVPANSKK